MSASTRSVADLFAFDALLDDEERAIASTVADFGAKRLRPHVAQWFEDGTLPARPSWLSNSASSASSVCTWRVTVAPARPRSRTVWRAWRWRPSTPVCAVSCPQGSLAMYAIRAFGSDEQREEWLPRMAKGEAIGCFGLTEPDFGSNPAGMRTAAKRDGDDWILNGAKMWITNAPVADVAVVWAKTDLAEGARGVRGFVVPTDTPGFSAPEIKHKMSLRASITGEIVLEDVRLPASAMLPGVEGSRAR